MIQSIISIIHRRKLITSLFLLCLFGLLSLGQASTIYANARGDDYPYSAINAVDQWGLYTRQCTSFVAHRLSSANGFTLPRAYGNADVWGSRARREGYRVDMNPAVGSVAWWDSMHVAWVSAVYGDKVEIEEYNYGYRNTYNKRIISKYDVSGYIHFKDLGVGSNSTAPTTTSSSHLATSGTYHFTSRTPIKNEANMASTDIDYYDVGESVRYDQSFESGGYQWISYMSYSGKRRYIPIKQTSNQVVATPAPTSTTSNSTSLPSQGSYTLTSRSSIRNAASLSSPEISYYEAGASVRYDRIVHSEGKQWISYISYSGVRRYIAI